MSSINMNLFMKVSINKTAKFLFIQIKKEILTIRKSKYQKLFSEKFHYCEHANNIR